MSGVLAVDVGGTFTDLVHWDGCRLRVGKVPSTPADQSVGVLRGAQHLPPSERFLHGTTVATNALLEHRGARTALVTSPGFTDVVEIGRQDRPSLYDSMVDRAEPLVDAELRFPAPDDPSTWEIPDALVRAPAIAISLLYGFERRADEAALVAALRAANVTASISASSEVVPEFREYERTATTVLNAYLAPEAGRYLTRLVARCREAGLPDDVLVMRSSGGLIPIAEAARLPASILLSGPAGGVMAAAAVGTATGRNRLVSFDMGGTSSDVCRIDDGHPEVSYEREIAGYPCRLPSVAIHTVGAGGGSIAWRDEGGSLRVGPRSAGADPGPAAYGRGGSEPAVTDANVILGRIGRDARLAGSMRLRADLAQQAARVLGDSLGLSPVELAGGIAAVVEEVMAGAVRKVSLEEGTDPREATLVAFGGAGGLHATALARRLGMAGVVVPLHAGVFSALGLLASPPRVDVAQSRLIDNPVDARFETEVSMIRSTAEERLARTIGSEPAQVAARVDVRYRGQSHEISVPLAGGEGWAELAARFHGMHAERNGFSRPSDPIEAVTFRAVAVGRPALTIDQVPVPAPVGDAVVGVRSVVEGVAEVEATVVRREGLAPGDEVVGPAVVEEREATMYLATGDRAVVHDSGALEVEW